MGTIVVTEFVSLDGVFEDPGGAEDYEYGGWTFEYDRGDEGNAFKLDELMDAKVQLLGRVTYEGFAEAWPSREGPFAEKLNSDPKVVVSTTLTDPQWQNTTVIDSDVVERLKKLRDDTDGSILVSGSGLLVETLLGDRLHLAAQPDLVLEEAVASRPVLRRLARERDRHVPWTRPRREDHRAGLR